MTTAPALELDFDEVVADHARKRWLRVNVPPVFRALTEPARYKGAYGGRGGSKSHFFAGMAIIRSLSRPRRIVCVREFQRSLEQSVKRLLEDKIKAFDLGSHFRILNTHIESRLGGIIIFQGMQAHTAESIKSLEGYDIAWVEEAQALSQRSLDLLRPTIRTEGSELWFSWNPRHDTDPVDSFLRGPDRPSNAVVIESSWKDNPWFPQVLRDEMEWDRTRDPDKYVHVWSGGYVRQSEARVFKNWRTEEFDTPADARFYLGGDWGFAVDPSVLVRCFVEGRRLYIDAEAYKVGCEIDYLPFLFGGTTDEELRKLNRSAYDDMPESYRFWPGIPGARKWPMIADSARPETISYLQRHGFPNIKPARKGAGSVEEGIEFLRSHEIVVHERCTHAIDELTSYCYKTDPLTDEVIPVLEDRKNHVIDSLRYAVENLRQPAKPAAGVWRPGRRR